MVMGPGPKKSKDIKKIEEYNGLRSLLEIYFKQKKTMIAGNKLYHLCIEKSSLHSNLRIYKLYLKW